MQVGTINMLHPGAKEKKDTVKKPENESSPLIGITFSFPYRSSGGKLSRSLPLKQALSPMAHGGELRNI